MRSRHAIFKLPENRIQLPNTQESVCFITFPDTNKISENTELNE